jgi:murein DD-endopeptidase MepM/ murein hydrolase activator NlpD
MKSPLFARNDVPDGHLKMADGKWASGGNIMLMDHGEGEYSLFAHMHQGGVMVKKGDRVKRGDTIGLLGSSGSPGSPHLHYQLQNQSGPVRRQRATFPVRLVCGRAIRDDQTRRLSGCELIRYSFPFGPCLCIIGQALWQARD